MCQSTVGHFLSTFKNVAANVILTSVFLNGCFLGDTLIDCCCVVLESSLSCSAQWGSLMFFFSLYTRLIHWYASRLCTDATLHHF